MLQPASATASVERFRKLPQNTSTNVYMDVEAQGSGTFNDVGLSMGTITVKT